MYFDDYFVDARMWATTRARRWFGTRQLSYLRDCTAMYFPILILGFDARFFVYKVGLDGIVLLLALLNL